MAGSPTATGPNGPNEFPREQDVVLVLKSSEASPSYSIYSVAETEGDADVPVALSTLTSPTLPEALQGHLLHQAPAHLISNDSHQLHVIVSTRSGLGRSGDFWANVVQPLLAAVGSPASDSTSAHGYQVVITEHSRSVRDFAERLGTSKAHPSNTVILLSGDGGIVDLLNGADELPGNTTVALLPLGTGNALFHSLHKPFYQVKDTAVPSPFVLGLRTLLRGTPKPLPTFRASFSEGAHLVQYTDASGNTNPDADAKSELQEKTTAVTSLSGAIVASYGFHASLVWESDTPDYRKHGAKRFGMAAQELLKLGHSYTVQVQVRRGDDTTWAELTPGERFDYVVATLVSNLEKTFAISPAGRPLDGQLRLVHFGDVGGERTMQIMMAAYQEGAHLDMVWGEDAGPVQKVGYEAIEALRVTVQEEDARWRKVCIDGTIVDIPKGGWMEVQRSESVQLQILAAHLD